MPTFMSQNIEQLKAVKLSAKTIMFIHSMIPSSFPHGLKCFVFVNKKSGVYTINQCQIVPKLLRKYQELKL